MVQDRQSDLPGPTGSAPSGNDSPGNGCAGNGATPRALSPWLQSHRFWLSLSMLVAMAYAALGLAEGFSGAGVVQDDARQHVFWMLRFADPDLFPQDSIADFFQSVAPVGYTTLYRAAAFLGVDPLLFNKLLHPLIILATTVYTYWLALELIPVAAMGGLSAILLNQAIWSTNDVASGTPRAFAYLLLTAFLYYALRQRLWPYLATIVLQSWFYPHTVMMGAAFSAVRLVDWNGRRLRLGADRAARRFYLIGIGLAIALLLPYAVQTSNFGPTVSLEQAQQMPEFWPGGRAPFFHSDGWHFWVEDGRSGLLPHAENLPQWFGGALLLPPLLMFPACAPLLKQHRSRFLWLAQLGASALGLFGLAHLLLFDLHLPARYSEFTLRLILSLAVAAVLLQLFAAITHAGRSRGAKSPPERGAGLRNWGKITSIILVVALIYVPTTQGGFIKTSYTRGTTPELYDFLAEQPTDTTIAGLTPLMDFIPSLAARSVVYSHEYAIPYQLGYYGPLRERAIALLQAQYSSDLSVVQQTQREYDVDFWLLEPDSFNLAFLDRSPWLAQFSPALSQVRSQLQQGETPALSSLVPSCTVFQSDSAILLSARCVEQAVP